MLKVLTLALLPSVTLSFHQKKAIKRPKEQLQQRQQQKPAGMGFVFWVLTFKDVDPGEKIRLLRTGLVLYDNGMYLKILFDFKAVST